MSLSKATATQIVNAVKADIQCKQQIESVLSYFLMDEWGWAGGIRNYSMAFIDGPNNSLEWAVNQFLRLKAPAGTTPDKVKIARNFPKEKKWVDDMLCTGIADTTSAVINRAIRAKLIPEVKSAGLEPRNTGIAHAGTHIQMTDGTDYIFDWHATLNIANPMICLTHKWHSRQGGIPFDHFHCYGAPPVLR